jgi:polyhydroxyalkanoate synthesis regulator phasin
MANTKSAQNNDWFRSSQQYWDTWFEAQRKTFGEQPSGFQAPWAEFFKEWQNTVSRTQSSNNTEQFQQYFAKAGETYLNMMQQFYQGTGQAKPLDQMAKEWTDGLQKFFSGAFQTNTQPFDPADIYTKWTSGFQPQQAQDPFAAFDPLGFFASMPGIGYTREKQEKLNHLYQQWAEYESKSRAYNAGMAKVGMEAVQKFQEYLASPPKDAEPLKSLKEVYAKWVDVCEEIYARYAMTEEYTKLYGEVVNALMTFKKQQNKMTDDMMDQFNLPTRQEVDSLHERLHALRREVAELKAALKPKPAAAAPKAEKPAKKGKKKS